MKNLHSKKYKILFVDDEPTILQALKRLFKSEFEVLTADSYEAGLEALQENKDLAIVLSDLHLPNHNGIDLLKKAKSISPNTVRAILSGQIDLNDMMEAVNRAVINRFVLKPWDNEYLKLQVSEALQYHLLLCEKNHLQHLAVTDLITGLTNHRYFQEALIREFDRASRHDRPLSLAMVDVDHFKNFNDTYGHPAGDQALSQIGQIMSHQVRSIDIVSRYGGEEFSIIMPDTAIEQAFDVAERVRLAVEKHKFKVGNKNTGLTVSIGVSQFPPLADSSQKLINSADQALYQAKNNGRNQTISAV